MSTQSLRALQAIHTYARQNRPGYVMKHPHTPRNCHVDAKCHKFSAVLPKTQIQICHFGQHATFYLVVAHTRDQTYLVLGDNAV